MRAEARQARRRHLRHGLLQLSLLLAVVCLLGRAFQLQVVRGARYRADALSAHKKTSALPEGAIL